MAKNKEKGGTATAEAEGTPKVNKSKAIKECLARDPQPSAKEITAELAAKGIEVTPNYVSAIKNQSKDGGGKKRKSSDPTITELKQASAIAREFGGIKQVRAHLQAAKQFHDKFGGDFDMAFKSIEALHEVLPLANELAEENKQEQQP